MKTKKKPNPNYQAGCIPVPEAIEKLKPINNEGFKVQYFRFVVISEQGNKLTMTFDPKKYAREQAKK